MNRRSFIRVTAPFIGGLLGSQALASCQRALRWLPSESLPEPDSTATLLPPAPTATIIDPTATPKPNLTQVLMVTTEDREEGLQRALSIYGVNDFRGKRTLVKPNLNSSHSTPGSTHNDVLRTTLTWLGEQGVDRITVGDRSGMERTRRVMEKKDLPYMAEEIGFELIAFDELPPDAWESFQFEGSHWPSGFAIARPVVEAEAIVSLCCLKTHRFGGHFTLSLKNSVGMVAYQIPGERVEYMNQLHSSPNQRLMIAEINAAYQPDLIVLDAVEAYVDGGPESGTLARPGLILVGRDRVAMDALGVAILRHYGTTPEVQQGRIFDQAQIARAVSLGLGVDGPEKVELVAGDAESQAFIDELQSQWLAG